MAKIALITDTHFGVRNDSMIFHDYFDKSMKFFFDTLDKRKIKHCIHLGDLFDRRKYLNFLTASKCRTSFLEQLDKRHIDTHIIAGNHDEYHKNSHVINALEEIVGSKYATISHTAIPKIVTIDGLPILLLPWITDSNMEMSLNAISKAKAEIVMGHLEISGFEMYKGSVQEHGMDRKVVDRFDAVFTGHYHHKSSSGNIHYLGAFAEFYWSDYNDPRGFHIFDTKTRKIEFIENPNKIFHMISYDDLKTEDIMSYVDNLNVSKYKDCYMRVVCVNRTNLYAFDALIDKIHKAGPADLSVVEDAISFIDNNENEDVDSAQDTPNILNSYIDGLTLPVENDIMKDYLQQVYVESLSVESI